MRTAHAIFIGSAAVLIGVTAIVVTDCAPPTEGDSSALISPPAVSPCQAYAVSRCERMDACTGGVWVEQFFGSRAACEEHVGQACALRATAPGMSLTSGGIDACTAALSEASCADFFGGIPACRLAPGTLANDEPCTYPMQCASAWCERAPGSGCGVCATRPTPPVTVPCGTSSCTAPGVCVLGHCAIPIATYAAPIRAGGPIDGLGPIAEPGVTGSVQVAIDQQCDGGCSEGFTCLGMTVPSISDPAQHTTRFGCAPSGSDPLACAHAGLVLDPSTGECEPPVDAIPAASFVPTRAAGPVEGLAPPPDPRLAATFAPAIDQQCEGGCSEGYTCMSITIPSVSDPSQHTTRFGCAPSGASPLASAVLTASFVPTRAAGPIDGLAPAVDPRLAPSIALADARQCEVECGEGYTCMSITIPSVSDPSQHTTRFGCAPAPAAPDPLASAIPASAYPRATTREGGPIDGISPAADPGLAGALDVDITIDSQQCDDGRGCGDGFTCVRIRVPSVTEPGQSTTRLACAPASPDAFACARAGLVLNTTTGECQKPNVASPGEACGASHPGVVCGEAGRCVRAAQTDPDGVCVAASPDGSECFADRWRGPGCMLPSYCARAPGAEIGTCRRPAPALCGE